MGLQVETGDVRLAMCDWRSAIGDFSAIGVRGALGDRRIAMLGSEIANRQSPMANRQSPIANRRSQIADRRSPI